jgi:hypothetical protein
VGTFSISLAITEDLKVIQTKFQELTVLGLHDDITITAHRRQDFWQLLEAAKFMKPVLLEEGSRMNMAKTRFVYYGKSELPEDRGDGCHQGGMQDRVRFVTKDSTTRRGRTEGTTTYMGCLAVGPSRDAIACRDRWSYKT